MNQLDIVYFTEGKCNLTNVYEMKLKGWLIAFIWTVILDVFQYF